MVTKRRRGGGIEGLPPDAPPASRAADVVILNAYPKDTELIQATMAINVAYLKVSVFPWASQQLPFLVG
jgi:hypothetical protein